MNKTKKLLAGKSASPAATTPSVVVTPTQSAVMDFDGLLGESSAPKLKVSVKRSAKTVVEMLPHHVGKVAHAVTTAYCGGNPANFTLSEVASNALLLSLACRHSLEESVEEYMLANANSLYIMIGKDKGRTKDVGMFMASCRDLGLLDWEFKPTEELALIVAEDEKYTPVLCEEALAPYHDTNPNHKALMPAIRVLEQVSTCINTDVLECLNTVMEDYSVGRDTRKLLSNDLSYIDKIRNTHVEIGQAPVWTNWKGQNTGRIDPRDYVSPNFQSGAAVKSLVQFSPQKGLKKYDPLVARDGLKAYMLDECKIEESDLNGVLKRIMSDPTQFLRDEVYGMEGSPDPITGISETEPGSVKKPTLALSLGQDLIKVLIFISQGAAGPQPFIGSAVGIDCKCSGAQLTALIVNNTDILQRTGWSQYDVDDVYQYLLELLEVLGFTNGGRDEAKDLWNPTQYGQGIRALTQLDPKSDLHAFLFGKGQPADWEKAKDVYGAILEAFGEKTVGAFTRVRESICRTFFPKDGGKPYHTPLVCGDLTFKMPDGYVVKVNPRVHYGLDGEVVDGDIPDFKYQIGDKMGLLQSFKVKAKNEIDYAAMASKTWVSFIHAVDAFVLRDIILNAAELGIKNLKTVHDCLYVSVDELPLIRKAIDMAYINIFGSETMPEKSDRYPEGLDMLGLLYDGIHKIRKVPMERNSGQSQFYGSDPSRPKVRRFKGVPDAVTGDIRILSDYINMDGVDYWH